MRFVWRGAKQRWQGGRVHEEQKSTRDIADQRKESIADTTNKHSYAHADKRLDEQCDGGVRACARTRVLMCRRALVDISRAMIKSSPNHKFVVYNKYTNRECLDFRTTYITRAHRCTTHSARMQSSASKFREHETSISNLKEDTIPYRLQTEQRRVTDLHVQHMQICVHIRTSVHEAVHANQETVTHASTRPT